MAEILTLLLILVVVICILFWVLPKIIAWLFERKFNAVLSIGRIGLPYLKLYDVHLTKKDFTIHIDEISIKSSFFNSELTKLITVIIKDIRINKDIGLTYTSNIKPEEQFFDNVDFRRKKVPRFINTFAQFMAVHIYNVSAMLLRFETPGCLIHTTAKHLHLDGSIVQNARTLLVNVNLTEATTKILRHPEKHADEVTCLAELSFAVTMEATFTAQGPLSVEKLIMSMEQSGAVINDTLYALVQGDKKRNIKIGKYNNEDSNFYSRFLPVIPKNFELQVKNTSLRSVREKSRIDFNSSLQNLSLRYFINSSNSKEETEKYFSHMKFRVKDLQVQNSKQKLLTLDTLTLDAKVEKNIVNLYLKVNILMLAYNHTIIYKWIQTNFLRTKSVCSQFGDDSDYNISINRDVTKLEKLLNDYVINGCAEFSQVSALVQLYDYNSSIGFNHMKLILEQAVDYRSSGNKYVAFLPRLLLSNHHWQMEVLVESLWWSFKEWTKNNYVTKKNHIWGTPVYLGMALVKFGTCDNKEIKVESLLDTLQLEWCHTLAEYILLAIKCFKQYKIDSFKTSQNGTKTKIEDDYRLSVHMALTHFNCFFQSQTKDYFVIRLDSLTLDKSLEVSNVDFKELKILTMYELDKDYNCIRSEDITSYKCYIKAARVEIKQNRNTSSYELTVHLFENTVTYWSANLHLKILYLTRSINNVLKQIKEDLEINSVSDKLMSSNVFSLNIFDNFVFHVEISEKHTAKVTVDDLLISYNNDGGLSVQNKVLVISIDDADIFTIQGLHLHRLSNNQMIRDERLDNENFQMPWNKTWSLSVDLFRALFPYHHNYSDAVQNELISIFKWLKIVHCYRKESFTFNSPLPNDMLIMIKEFLFEMSDDPFEVKLRDNFELLEDEYNESLKRQKKLKEKVAELCKTHLHLPAGKVEELYASLKKINAEIYIQRSKQMLHAAPTRTRLFAWSMTNIQAMVLADSSIHGSDNVIRVMREIDPDSPWPEEGLEFSTLWCRVVSLRCKEWKFQLRDFPQPLLHIHQCYICGQLVGAEQIAPRRARRSVVINLGEPFGFVTLERGMLPLKFYHDLNCEIQSYSYAFGPCWEPVIAQCNLSFEKIIAPSRDPSPPLPFWDKMRLILHGRLTMVVQQLTVLLHASLDPYNTTEEMELTWNQVIIDWTNAKFVYKGDFNIFVRTASKYDDCKLLHLPNLKLIIGMQWICLGDPNDHHNVVQCAPDKVPEYSSNQVHDSFRAFRSQNVNLSMVLETRPVSNQSPTSNYECPMLLLYGSTLRWFENLKLILSGVTRPTKRGPIFQNVRPRKIQLSRHYKKIHLLMGLHKFQVFYWMSFAMQRGCELLGGRLSSSSEHTLSLIPIQDGLKHRPKAEWSIVYMNSELNDSEIWLKSALQEDPEKETISLRQPVEKCYCLSVAKVSYGRETILPGREHAGGERDKDIPTHRLVVYDLRGAWTKSNRNVAFALFDTFMKNKQMKKNLSTEALKGFRKDTNNTTPLKRRNADVPGTPPNANSAIQSTSAAVQDIPSPLNKLQSGHAANMLQQLIAEAENKAVVFSDDLSSATRQQHLQGLQACQEDDVQHKNWLIALVNAQVLLKGCETKGYVILSAAKAEIHQRIHRPVWKDRTLVSKTTWTGTLECLQYYATVNAGESDASNESIMWLSVDNIQEKESTEISEPSEVPNMVGSGVSVGAVVSDTVGASTSSQLQRIVSRCKCEFFYAGYGDISVDPEAVGEVPPPPQEDVGPWDRRQIAVDAFTLMHHDLDVCTNSLQYTMLLDIVNNLLLYVEPHRKEALERLARMRFQLQLHSGEDQKRPIQNQQTLVRATFSKLRRLEKDTYLISKALAEDPTNIELIQEMEKLEQLVYECKNQLNGQSDELDMMLSCYKESQLLVTNRLATTRNDKPLTIVRANEICFKHAQWRLTETDGQIGIADLVLSNFLYTKNSKSDDSVEHLLELGYLRMTNLLPNEIYNEVLCPTEIQFNMPVEHKRVVRVFCREKPPVGGISVKEHFEINVVPLTIGLTKKFYNTMLKFCFPERDPDNIEYNERSDDGESENKGKKSKTNKRNRDSNFYIHIDDIEKMKERAEKNKLFVYIKIPEVPVRVSYKGNKEKNLEDLRDVSLVIPTLEYHNMTWTWLDLLMAIRNDSRRVILSQAIKQKLQIKRNTGSLDESCSPHEEDKARMLFGTRHAVENKSMKKGVGGVFKFGK